MTPYEWLKVVIVFLILLGWIILQIKGANKSRDYKTLYLKILGLILVISCMAYAMLSLVTLLDAFRKWEVLYFQHSSWHWWLSFMPSIQFLGGTIIIGFTIQRIIKTLILREWVTK